MAIYTTICVSFISISIAFGPLGEGKKENHRHPQNNRSEVQENYSPDVPHTSPAYVETIEQDKAAILTSYLSVFSRNN